MAREVDNDVALQRCQECVHRLPGGLDWVIGLRGDTGSSILTSASRISSSMAWSRASWLANGSGESGGLNELDESNESNASGGGLGRLGGLGGVGGVGGPYGGESVGATPSMESWRCTWKPFGNEWDCGGGLGGPYTGREAVARPSIVSTWELYVPE